jgi:hypothetical protein
MLRTTPEAHSAFMDCFSQALCVVVREETTRECSPYVSGEIVERT